MQEKVFRAKLHIAAKLVKFSIQNVMYIFCLDIGLESFLGEISQQILLDFFIHKSCNLTSIADTHFQKRFDSHFSPRHFNPKNCTENQDKHELLIDMSYMLCQPTKPT